MFGELNQEQVERVLYAESVGRIGCYAERRTYVVPINYVYDGESIYGHSINGMKLQMMRLNPEVCFEIDQIKNASNWQSVIAWGTFEELKGEEAAHAMHLLVQRMLILIASGQSIHEMVKTDAPHTDAERHIMSVYRIHLVEKTGRFEKD